MTETLSDSRIVDMLRRAGIRPSVQRIAVFAYIANERCHPSADDIFTELTARFPSMSRTTVYNALHALIDASLVRELEIESGNMRYDMAPQPSHSHFVCRRCGRIFDMPMPAGVGTSATDGFRVDEVNLFFKGLCPACAAGIEA